MEAIPIIIIIPNVIAKVEKIKSKNLNKRTQRAKKGNDPFVLNEREREGEMHKIIQKYFFFFNGILY